MAKGMDGIALEFINAIAFQSDKRWKESIKVSYTF